MTFKNQKELDELMTILCGTPYGISYGYILDPLLSIITGEAHVSPVNFEQYFINRRLGVYLDEENMSIKEFVTRRWGPRCAELMEKLF